MTRIRSLATQMPAIIISVLALAFSLGGGSYAATHLDTQRAQGVTHTTVTFHSLTLLNGWKSAQTPYHTGDSRVAISNGIVYLAGSIHQPIPGGSGVFATLPARYRPTHYLYLPVYT